jgi:hypothetical protein
LYCHLEFGVFLTFVFGLGGCLKEFWEAVFLGADLGLFEG